MARKPRQVHDRLIDARMWASVIQTGVVIALVTLLTLDFYLPGGLIAGAGDLTTARTAGFTVLVFTSLFTCFTARSDTTVPSPICSPTPGSGVPSHCRCCCRWPSSTSRS